MADPYVGEIRVFSFDYAPRGWAQCNGQLMPINQNQVLFAILGTTYGGDGITTFALPNLAGRVPVHVGNTVTLGQAAGEANHTLTADELPHHSHLARASNITATQVSPQNNVWGSRDNVFSNQAGSAMSAESVANSGGSQGHSNMQPYTVVNFCIALTGIFPPHN
ncbi:MAG: phage tail protein [Alicyclobacillus sp. RIFOXYA1_FULL_53_8]|nr:MAG: phage tail protein [Alicyclobacillus sp. RIFOXYA1_FULL_53_8]